MINQPNSTDPIFALATSSQRSALHLHRISGVGIFEKIIAHTRKPKVVLSSHFPHVQYTSIYHMDEIIDDVMILFYRSPKSFTGEDMIEITCHGNPLISQKLQSFFRFLGFRDAKEGEFTNRAFLNSKLDLSQAEAIRELIHAETQAGVQLSRKQLKGDLSQEIYILREEFIHLLTYLEAHIDFAPDEVGQYEPQVLLPKLTAISKRLIILKDSYSNGIKLKEGLKFVLCGRPNAGKSTLYNTLLKEERAIVTDVAGTTRDVLSERLAIQNRDFIIMDTAGLRKTTNRVEKLGVERSMKAVADADIICILIDGTKPVKPQLQNTPALPHKNIIFIISKCDSIHFEKQNKIVQFVQEFIKNQENGHSHPVICVSRNNVESFIQALINTYDHILNENRIIQSTSPILISARTHDKVSVALKLLKEAEFLLENNDLPEKIASCLYCSLKSLEEILGEVNVDEIYDQIFSTFCIGK